jgi:hypothetical protein
MKNIYETLLCHRRACSSSGTPKTPVLILIISLLMFGALQAAEPSKQLVSAIIRVESSGNDMAIGDKHMRDKAYGPMQIRKPCVDDVNRRFGTTHRPEDCLGNRALSEQVFRRYMTMYATKARLGHEPTDEDYSRIWNGGPNGWKNPLTKKYWEKVQRYLAPSSVHLTQK